MATVEEPVRHHRPSPWRPQEPADDAAPDVRSREDRIVRCCAPVKGERAARPGATARERLELLLDEGSFHETEALVQDRGTEVGSALGTPHSDGVVTGWGLVSGRTVFVYAHDPGVFEGTLGETSAAKVHKVMDRAQRLGAPLVSVCDGARVPVLEGVGALARHGGIMRRHARASGVIPQISVVLGPCSGTAAYSPALTDFVFMVDGTSQLAAAGPAQTASATGVRTSLEDLGGTLIHAHTTGTAGFSYPDERSCLTDVRHLIGQLPANNTELPPWTPSGDTPQRRCEALLDLVPTDPGEPYDIRPVIREIADADSYFEVHEAWAPNVVCALVRLDGEVVGVVANQPGVQAGALDARGAQKAARFVTTCDAFNIALVTLVDVPGFLPGPDSERDGVLRCGAQLLYAYGNAAVPRVSVVLRKAYGTAYLVMDSRSAGADLAFAWPANEIAVTGAEDAADRAFSAGIEGSDDPDATREHLAKQYRAEFMHPYDAAERGLIDEIIDPVDTRRVLIDSLAALHRKHADLPLRKHGNPPL
ncbi:acyl-CoA carboxylase subunit beta [Streptomyces triticagri]|uniref:Acyl-CoA carboxylase subunit beta n=1 Tax=Streptomyces triticagri TaxID=2293568 RepID=A0A372MB41_9ACTN|nr:acyl-CoA carboxylase subunit beta [Streptomyces triticagri]RFU88162.1 acyl-CoA carboxylase subunit beta [Streptomyces triticagri]